MAEITVKELRELELRRSQDDLQTLLAYLREDGEIVVVDEDAEAEDDSVPSDAWGDAFGNPVGEPVLEGALV